MLLWNITLAIAWAALNGQFSLRNLLVGFALGYLILWLVHRAVGKPGYHQKASQLISFALFYLWGLVQANLRVAYDVLTPRYHMRPGVIAIPLDANTDAEIMLFANLITLTPATLSLDVSTDRRVLYIHAMYIDDVEAVRQRIKQDLERRVLEVMR
jgi:multicomponent Na+:H+ antiporter subunit E